MRIWNIVHPKPKMLSPAVDAFHCFIIEHVAAHLITRDAALPAVMPPGTAAGVAPLAAGTA